MISLFHNIQVNFILPIFMADIRLHIPFVIMIKFQSLVLSSVDYLSESCLIFYSFCASLLNTLIMWLTLLALSPQIPHLLIAIILSIFLWRYWFFWLYFVLLLKELQFRSYAFLNIFISSQVKSVDWSMYSVICLRLFPQLFIVFFFCLFQPYFY